MNKLKLVNLLKLNGFDKTMPDEGGWFLISAIIMILFLTAVGLSVSQLTTEQYQHTQRESFAQNAELVAEAGIEQSIYELNNNDSFNGYSTPQQFFDNSSQGKSTFTVTVTNNADGKSKTIIATGDIYRTDNSTTPYLTQTVRAIAVGTSSTGYSVSTGPGGLILSGSATITNSNVYVDGKITMSGNSSIGTSTAPADVTAANYACPSGGGSSYPALCTGSSRPISLSGNAKIYGNSVCANGQTSQTGIKSTTFTNANCTRVSQPVYNRSSIISNVASTVSGTSGTYGCSGNKTVTLPANIELTGSTVTWNSSCKVIVSGNVYIPGNLSASGAAQIKTADSVGSTRPVVAVDGTINISGSSSMIDNSDGTGIDFVSFKNSTGNPGATPTGTDLYNSQQEQNVSVSGATNSPGTVYDAYWSEVTLSGSGNVGAAAGQTVNLSGAGTVIFGTTLSSGSKTWKITSFQPLYGLQ